MPSAVDHLVLRVADVDEAVDTYRRLGFIVTERPPVAYIVFANFYLELTATEEAALVLRSDDPAADAERHDAALPLRFVGHDHRLDVPRPTPHPNTATVLERTYIAVDSIDRELERFEKALGMSAPEPEMGTVIMSMMSVFYLGDIGIAVAEPRGPGPTADALAESGPGLFQVLFRADHLDNAAQVMVDNGLPPPARGTRLSGESALLVGPDHACGIYVAMAGLP